MTEREDDVEAQRQAALALYDDAVELSSDGRDDDAVGRYDEIIERWASTEDEDLEVTLIYARYNKARVLRSLDNYHDAMLVLADLVDAHEEPPDEGLERVVDGMLLAGDIWKRLGQTDLAEEVGDDIRELFGHAGAPYSFWFAAVALHYKAWTVAELGRWAEALALYEELLEHVGDPEDVRLLAKRAQGRCGRGECLEHLWREPEALEEYRRVLAEHADGEDEEIDECLEWARGRLEYLTG